MATSICVVHEGCAWHDESIFWIWGPIAPGAAVHKGLTKPHLTPEEWAHLRPSIMGCLTSSATFRRVAVHHHSSPMPQHPQPPASHHSHCSFLIHGISNHTTRLPLDKRTWGRAIKSVFTIDCTVSESQTKHAEHNMEMNKRCMGPAFLWMQIWDLPSSKAGAGLKCCLGRFSSKMRMDLPFSSSVTGLQIAGWCQHVFKCVLRPGLHACSCAFHGHAM